MPVSPGRDTKEKGVEGRKTEAKLNYISGEFIELQGTCQVHHIYKGFQEYSTAITATEQVKNA